MLKERAKRLVKAAAYFAGGAMVAGSVLAAFAQGLPFVYPFVGVQPAQTVDFSNPPISFGRSNGAGGVLPVSNVPIGSVAYASFGTETASDLYDGNEYQRIAGSNARHR